MKKREEQKTEFPALYYVLGADFSLNRPGFCILCVKEGSVRCEKLYSVDNKSKPCRKPRGQVLTEIADALRELIGSVSPLYIVREASINNAVFGRRSGTAARTGISEVAGVSDYIAWQFDKQWHELYPVSIKKLVTGSGKATKEEVAECLKNYIGSMEYANDDESDAAAVAIAWLIQKNQLKCRPANAARKSAA